MWMILFISLCIFTQDKTEVVYEPTSGGVNLRVVDDIIARVNAMKEKEVMIIILRLGKGENPKLVAYRIEKLKDYLFNERKLSPEKFLFAQGESTNSYGRAEFYADGKLLQTHTLVAEKNLGFPLCCGCPNSSFYTPSFIKHKNYRKRFLKSSH